MRKLVKRVALCIPPLKRLVVSRDHLTKQCGELINQHDRLTGERDELLSQRDALLHQVEVFRKAAKVRRPWLFPTLTPDEIASYQQRIDSLTARCEPSGWFHSLDLGNGLLAPGVCNLQVLRDRLEWLNFPLDLSGQSFLDFGAWDGFYSFEAEQRGAARVLATDSFCWGGGGWGSKDGFLLAREILRSRVEDMTIDIMDASPTRLGTFDVVLFSGMLYHMRDPLQALTNAASVTEKHLIVETAVECEQGSEFTMRYVPRLNPNNRSNYWRPTPDLVCLWLRELGFAHVEQRGCGDASDDVRGFFNAYRE